MPDVGDRLPQLAESRRSAQYVTPCCRHLAPEGRAAVNSQRTASICASVGSGTLSVAAVCVFARRQRRRCRRRSAPVLPVRASRKSISDPRTKSPAAQPAHCRRSNQQAAQFGAKATFAFAPHARRHRSCGKWCLIEHASLPASPSALMFVADDQVLPVMARCRATRHIPGE